MEFEEMKYDPFVQELKQGVCGHPKVDRLSKFGEMAGLMNRSRSMAEGVVVMVCPVLLALALDKIDHKVYRHGAFMAMLAMAGLTLISGICPVIACSFSQRFPGVNYVRPAPVTSSLAILSYSCLLILACFIAQLIVSVKILSAVGVLGGGFVLIRTAVYYYGLGQSEPYPLGLHDILDESHEFLTGITGILFLGLEGLALQSHDNQDFQKGAGAVGTISLIVCALGVCLMYFEMIPPLHFNVQAQVVGFTLVLDFLMAVGTLVLLVKVTIDLVGIAALLLFTPLGIVIELAYRVAFEPRQDDTIQANPGIKLSTPASLELTRVTFTGFLAVSITAINNTSRVTEKNYSSPSKLTLGFLLFAAVAIAFGMSWRLLTQSQIRMCLANRDQVACSANLASLCTHFCIVIATILFLAMAWTK